jgi:NADPH:quinone reductase-like Zn-dependent oxidoreductase
MKAVQLISHGAPGGFQYCDVPDPVPFGDEVVVEVKACGLNRLDLWFEQGDLPVSLELPRTQGGEVAGVVAGLGEDVDQWKIGDRVAVQSNLFCGQCEFCARGEESICLNGVLLGVERDGGFAERVVAPARALMAIPEGIDFETSAAVTLAGSTAIHMLTDRVEVREGDWVLVIGGASGVGSAAIQIARQLGARVIATGSTAPKRELSSSLGAHFVVDSSSAKWASEVRRITAKRGVDIVVEHVGGDVLRSVFTCLARGGTVVTCGATAGREVPFNLWPFFVKQQRLIGSYGRNHADMGATLQWVLDGKLKPVIHKVFSLAETPAAFAALRDRNVLGKVLVKP